MLAVGVERAGVTLTCDVQLDGTAAAVSADVIYTPPAEGQPPRLTFQNGCKLQQGDAVQVRVVCAQ
jgi:hypothetical protein